MEMNIEGDDARLRFTPDERLVFLRKASYRLIDAACSRITLEESGSEARVLGESLYAIPFHNYHSELLLAVTDVPFIARCLAYNNAEITSRSPISEELEEVSQAAATYLHVELGVLEANLVIPNALPDDFS